MTDYNDGNWHIWNGGECPVHPNSEVECRLRDKSIHADGAIMAAECWHWDNSPEHVGSDIIAFRVAIQHREPREWWICCRDGHFPIVSTEWPAAGGFDEVIPVREVLD